MPSRYESVQDPFGIERTVNQLNANRKFRAEQPQRELREKILKQQFDTNELSLAGLATERKDNLDLRDRLSSAGPEEDKERVTFDFWKGRNPAKARKIDSEHLTRAAGMLKLAGGQAAVDYYNSKTGANLEFKGSNGGFHEIKSPIDGKTLILDDTGATIREIQTDSKAAVNNKQEREASKEKFKRAKDIRAEVDKSSKVFRDIQDAYGRVQVVGKSATSPAANLALVFNFMKMLDPGSVVRESEFATAEQARAWVSKTDEGKHPIPTIVKQTIQKATEGTFLTPAQIKDFVSQANALFKEKRGRHNATLNGFVKLAKRFGLEKEDIIVERGGVPDTIEQTATNPETGEVLTLKNGKWEK